MTVPAVGIGPGGFGRLGSWLSVRHSVRAESVLVFVLYGMYELARGLVVGDARDAVQHGRELIPLESTLHVSTSVGVLAARQKAWAVRQQSSCPSPGSAKVAP